MSGNSRYNSNGFNVTATQPLFRYQNWITYEQAKHQVSQAEAVARSEHLPVVIDPVADQEFPLGL